MILARAAASMLAAGLVCIAYGTAFERRWYRQRRIEVAGPLRGNGSLRILHLSDLHLIPGQQHRVDFLHSLASGDHDLVVVTGDLLGAPAAEDMAIDALAPLVDDTRPGVVVLGSNDFVGPIPRSPVHYFRDRRRAAHQLDPQDPFTARRPGARLDTQRLIDGLAQQGYHTLRNEAVTLLTRAGTVAVGGIDDPHMPTTTLPSPATVAPDAEADDAVLHLGLVHAPYRAALDILVDAGHDLLLAGHTHGGQVRLPGIGALVANCDLPLRQARGLSTYRNIPLHVSVGLGHSRYAPFRFACRPEATVLEIARA
ncbi:MAG: metallophosphoesterase [Nitriliruptoraceae bacterium]